MAFKFNPLTGQLDIDNDSGASSSVDNFSYNLIDTGQTITIPDGQQMLYAGDIRILGDLRTLGDLREVDRPNQDAFGLGTVAVGEVVTVPVNKILFVRNLRILGDLRVLGDIAEV